MNKYETGTIDDTLSFMSINYYHLTLQSFMRIIGNWLSRERMNGYEILYWYICLLRIIVFNFRYVCNIRFET